MINFDDYLKNISKMILESYQTIFHLKDLPGDLEIIKVEILKINGFVNVLLKKLESSKNTSDSYVKLQNAVKNYKTNYEFLREIETMSQLYSEDSGRLKSLRGTILKALKDKKFIEALESLERES